MPTTVNPNVMKEMYQKHFDPSIVMIPRVLQQASLLLFLLAKVYVTNGDRMLARWEKFIVWWPRICAWIIW